MASRTRSRQNHDGTEESPRLSDDERRRQRRSELLAAAVRVIGRDGPGASMESIAREAGITKPILYRQFGDRDGLIRALGDQWAAELSAGIGQALEVGPDVDPKQAVIDGINAYVELIERDPHLYRFLTERFLTPSLGPKDDPVNTLIDGIGRAIAVSLGERLRSAGVDSGGAEAWAYGLVGMVHLAGDWWVQRPTMPRQRLVTYLVNLVWDGMGASLSPPAPPADG